MLAEFLLTSGHCCPNIAKHYLKHIGELASDFPSREDVECLFQFQPVEMQKDFAETCDKAMQTIRTVKLYYTERVNKYGYEQENPWSDYQRDLLLPSGAYVLWHKTSLCLLPLALAAAQPCSDECFCSLCGRNPARNQNIRKCTA